MAELPITGCLLCRIEARQRFVPCENGWLNELLLALKFSREYWTAHCLSSVHKPQS